MLKSLLISALSACLAVWATLQYQQRVLDPPRPSFEDTKIHTDDDGSNNEGDPQLLQQQRQQQQQQQQQEQQQEHHSSNDDIPASIDLAQALGLGRVLLARGEPEESALAFRVAAAAAAGTSQNHHHADAKHGLGLALGAAGRPDEALEACQEAERLDPELAVASACVGALLTESEDIAGALKALRSAAEKVEKGGATRAAAEGGGIHGRLGAALLAAGKVDEAIPALVRALEGKARDHHAAYNLGVAWQSKGETEKSIAAYAQAVDLAPTLAPPRVNLGAQLLQSGRLPEAEVVLLTAVRLGNDAPSLAAAHSNLGAVLRRSGRAEQALESFSEAVRWGAGRSSLMHIAKIHQELGHPQEALHAAQRAMKEDGDPLDTSMPLLAGLMLESLGDQKEAAEYFAAVTYIDAGNVEATIHLGNCRQRLGRYHEALDAFLKASRLEPDNPEIYELIVSVVVQARAATAVGNPGVGDDPVDEARNATSVTNPGVSGGGQDPEEGTGAIGAGEAKDKGASPAAVFGAGQAGRGDGGGAGQLSGSVVKPPRQGADQDKIAGSRLTMDSRNDSGHIGGSEHGHGRRSDEGASAGVPGIKFQEGGKIDVAGGSNLGVDAQSGSADTASPGGANEDQDRYGADAPGGGRRGEGGADASVVDTDVAGVSSFGVDAQSGHTDGVSDEGMAEGTSEDHDQDSGANTAASVAGTTMPKGVDIDVSGASSLGADEQKSGTSSAGSVSTKASPEVAGASVREAAAEMRKRSDSLSQNDLPGTPPRGFFVPRERRDAQGNPEHASGADARATADGVPATADGTPAAAANGISATTMGGREGGLELSGTDANAERASLNAVDVSAMADGEAVLATPADEQNGGGEEVGAGERVLPGGSTVVLPSGDPAAADAVTPLVGTSGVLDSGSGSEGSSRKEGEEEEEGEGAGRVLVGIGAHSDTEDQPLAKTSVRVADASEAVSPPVADEPDSVTGENVVNSSEHSLETSSEVSSEVAEAASAGALAAEEEANGRGDGVTPEEVPPMEGTKEEDAVRDNSQGLSTEVENGSEVPSKDVGNIASSASAPEAFGEVDATVREKHNITPKEGIPVSGDALASPGDAFESPGGMLDGQTVRPADGDGAEQAEAVEPSVTAAPADLDAPDGTDPSSIMEGVMDVRVNVSDQSSPTTSPGAAGEKSPEATLVAVTDGGGTEEEGGGTATDLGASEGSPQGEQEKVVGVGEAQGEKADAGDPDGNPLVVGGVGETDVAGTSDGDGVGVGAAADGGAAVGGGVGTGDPAAATAVSEEEGRRARSKAKLGLARLQKGQTQKAVLMFEKAASIDPGWWGGFYYTALARDSLGDTEAAARSLISALSVDAPTEASEIAELSTLASKVLSSLDGDKAEPLKTAMDASSVTFNVTQGNHEPAASSPSSEPPLPDGSNPGDIRDQTQTPGVTGKGGGVGRATSMRDGAQGAGPGLEADLAHLGKRADPSLPVGVGSEKSKKDRWPLSGKGGPGVPPPPATGGVSASRGGEAGSIPGSSRGGIPGVPLREASPPAPVPARDGDVKGVQGSGRVGRREGGDAQAYPDAGRRKGWGRIVGTGSGGGNAEAKQSSQNGGGGGGSGGGGGGGARRSNGGSGVGSAVIDPNASAEEILASMGLKSGLSLGPDGVTGGVAAAPLGAKTPAEMMAESRGGGGGDGQDAGGGGGKRGLFGRLWKGKEKER